MSVWEIIFIGIALSMDAFAVGMTNGMTEPRMKLGKTLGVAFAFGLFQFGMPLFGYACGTAFAALVARFAPWLSFFLLGAIGGKMVVDYAKEESAKNQSDCRKSLLPVAGRRGLTLGKLLVQAVATSLDALAVGVTLLAAERTAGLPMPVFFCTLAIGSVTFCLSAVAVEAGKRVGNRFSDGATLAGGGILIAIGLKILLEGIL